MILQAAKRIFLPAAVAFLIYFAWQSRDVLIVIVQTAKPVYVVLAILVWSLMYALAAVFSVLIFRARNTQISYKTAIKIHVSNLPARYLPGGIWHTVGRIADFRNLGIGQRDIAIFVFLENMLGPCVAFVIGGSLLASYLGFTGWGQIAALSAIAAAAFLIASPYILSLRVIHGGSPFPVVVLAKGVLLSAVSWAVAAGAFVIYLAAFPGLRLQLPILEMVGAYLFSWGVGFISIFAPQGVGVFEVVAADIMRGTESLTNVAVLLAGFRLIILAADALAWTMLYAFSHKSS